MHFLCLSPGHHSSALPALNELRTCALAYSRAESLPRLLYHDMLASRAIYRSPCCRLSGQRMAALPPAPHGLVVDGEWLPPGTMAVSRHVLLTQDGINIKN